MVYRLKEMYVEEKRNSISMQEEINNSAFESKQKNIEKANYEKSSGECAVN